MGGKKGSDKTPYVNYHLSFHLGFCQGPVDAITGIWMKDKLITDTEYYGNATIKVDKPELFGGHQREGGAQGNIYWMDGSWGQKVPAELAQRLGGTPDTVPGFRGIAGLFFCGNSDTNTRGFIVSSNYPNVPNVKARLWRGSFGLSADYSICGSDHTYEEDGQTKTKHFLDSNPANVLWECLTDPNWGMGGSEDLLDKDSFLNACYTLFDEGFGISFKWTQQTTIEAIVQEILDHINGMLYFNPLTGKAVLKLLRADYNLDDCREFGPHNCNLLNFNRKLWGETANEIVVTYTNPVTEEEETISYQSPGNIAMQGAVVSESRNYYMVRSVALAGRLAARDIVSASYPLASAQITVNRSEWDVLPGEVILLSWPEPGYNIGSIAMRVMEVDYGEYDNSVITVDLLEDVFALDAAEYIEPPGSIWEEPTQSPEDPIYSDSLPTVFRAAPYPFIQQIPGYDLSDANHPLIVVAALATRETGMDDLQAFNLWKPSFDNFGNEIWNNLGEKSLTDRAVLKASLSPGARGTLTFQNYQGKRLRPEVGMYAIIEGVGEEGDEMIAVGGILDEETLSVERGLFDTTPKAWPAGSRVWFIPESFFAFDTFDPIAYENISYIVQPRTSGGVTPIEVMPILVTNRPDRHYRPFRPANVKVDGVAFGQSDSSEDYGPRKWTIDVTWSNRNRAVEDMIFRKWDEGPVSPEPGQTTRLVINDDYEISALSGNSHSIPVEETGQITIFDISVYADRDGYESIQAHSVSKRLYRKGYGSDFGYFYGGWPAIPGDMK